MLTDADFDIFIHHPLLGKMYPLFWKARTAKYGVNSNNYGKSQNMKVQRCMTCLNCRVADCTMCLSCKDKPRFGGPGLRKKACLQRPRCLNPITIEDFRKEHVQSAFNTWQDCKILRSNQQKAETIIHHALT